MFLSYLMSFSNFVLFCTHILLYQAQWLFGHLWPRLKAASHSCSHYISTYPTNSESFQIHYFALYWTSPLDQKSCLVWREIIKSHPCCQWPKASALVKMGSLEGLLGHIRNWRIVSCTFSYFIGIHSSVGSSYHLPIGDVGHAGWIMICNFHWGG